MRQRLTRPAIRPRTFAFAAGRKLRAAAAGVLMVAVGLPALSLAQRAPAVTASVLPSAPAPWDAAERVDRGVRIKALPRDLFEDQEALWGLPLRMRRRQWKVVLPLGLTAVALMASDTAAEPHLARSASGAKRFTTFSDAGLAAMAGVGGGMYLWGRLAHNERARETGFLSGEAGIDAFADTALIKSIAGRERPFTGNGRGDFFQGGSSFPSEHAAVSWAVASVIAHEYPGPMTKLMAYGLAGAVSAARVGGRKHFLSDAVLGSALGWYIGRQIYRARSGEAEIDPRTWGTFERYRGEARERAAGSLGSTYVPLDSWVYPVFDRLEAMGYLPEATSVLRPWTRIESARLLARAQEIAGDEAEALQSENEVAAPLLAALEREFAPERGFIAGAPNRGAQLESLYTRFTGISGTPLRDSFHFGQTLVDDDGRPYGEGSNLIAGLSQRAELGPLAIYLRGEYQYAGAIPAYSASAQQAIAAYDGLPYGWNLRQGTTSRLRPVEAYAALNLGGWQLSFGQQSLWWGPDRSTSMILSNNAEAMPMLRLARVRPSPLGGVLRGLGPFHFDIFFARQGGIHYVGLGRSFTLYGSASQGLDPPPYIWGFSWSIKPTPNFEFGFAHDAIFAGYGRPLNLQSFLHTFSILGNAQAVDPGKRTTQISFVYHVPGLRNWLVLYSEGFAYDSPTQFVQRVALDPGIYLPRLPGVPRMDLRVEGMNTNLPGLKNPAYFYGNAHYPQGYTNYGQIFGSWVGRQGTGITAKATYWFSPRNKIAAGFRDMRSDKTFLEGGQMDDVSASVSWMLRPNLELSAFGQYERWKFPLLATAARSDVATSIQLRFFPALRLRSALGHIFSGAAGGEGNR